MAKIRKEKDITLYLTKQEARVLEALIGNITMGNKPRRIADKIYFQLRALNKRPYYTYPLELEGKKWRVDNTVFFEETDKVYGA